MFIAVAEMIKEAFPIHNFIFFIILITLGTPKCCLKCRSSEAGKKQFSTAFEMIELEMNGARERLNLVARIWNLDFYKGRNCGTSTKKQSNEAVEDDISSAFEIMLGLSDSRKANAIPALSLLQFVTPNLVNDVC